MGKLNQKGLTLTEMLVIIGAVGILVAIAIPQFRSYRMESFNTAARLALSDLKRIQDNAYAVSGTYGHVEHDAAWRGATVDVIIAPFSGHKDARWIGISQHNKGDKLYCCDSLDAGGVIREEGTGSEYDRCLKSFQDLRREVTHASHDS